MTIEATRNTQILHTDEWLIMNKGKYSSKKESGMIRKLHNFMVIKE